MPKSLSEPTNSCNYGSISFCFVLFFVTCSISNNLNILMLHFIFQITVQKKWISTLIPAPQERPSHTVFQDWTPNQLWPDLNPLAILFLFIFTFCFFLLSVLYASHYIFLLFSNMVCLYKVCFQSFLKNRNDKSIKKRNITTYSNIQGSSWSYTKNSHTANIPRNWETLHSQSFSGETSHVANNIRSSKNENITL